MLKVVNCLKCDKEFSSISTQNRKYCSQKCYWSDKVRRRLLPPSRNGVKLTDSHKDKLSKSSKTNGNIIKTQYKKGHKQSDKWYEFRKKQIGINHPNWVGNKIKDPRKRLRASKKYKDWREKVFKRDNWTCQDCGIVGGYLEAHHIKSWKCYPKLRYIIDNGKTLCLKCHNKTKQGIKTK